MGFPKQECCHFLLQGIFLTQGSNPCLPGEALLNSLAKQLTSDKNWDEDPGCLAPQPLFITMLNEHV